MPSVVSLNPVRGLRGAGPARRRRRQATARRRRCVPALAYELALAVRRGLLRKRAVAHAVGRREVRDVDGQAVGARVGVELEHGAARLAMRRREGSIAAQVSPAPAPVAPAPVSPAAPASAAPRRAAPRSPPSSVPEPGLQAPPSSRVPPRASWRGQPCGPGLAFPGPRRGPWPRPARPAGPWSWLRLPGARTRR